MFAGCGVALAICQAYEYYAQSGRVNITVCTPFARLCHWNGSMDRRRERQISGLGGIMVKPALIVLR